MTKPLGPYTPIVKAGPWLVSSGQIGMVDGALVSGGVEAEVDQALTNLSALLASHGSSLADVAKTTVFLTSMDDYADMNRVYTERFGDHRPARSAIAVKELPAGAAVEIEAWTYVGDGA